MPRALYRLRFGFATAGDAPAERPLPGFDLLAEEFPTVRIDAVDCNARDIPGTNGPPCIDRRDWISQSFDVHSFDQAVDTQLRQFFYLPFMHSERIEDLDRCVALNEAVGGESLRYALHHREIVRRFGRFPHRNAALGRSSSADEERFLADGGFPG